MYKKKLYELKRKILKRLKTNLLNQDSIERLKNLGFSINYDTDYNMYLFDEIHNERMYTNTYIVKGQKLKISENKYYSLEFTIKNKNINNIRLYEKNKKLKKNKR